MNKSRVIFLFCAIVVSFSILFLSLIRSSDHYLSFTSFKDRFLIMTASAQEKPELELTFSDDRLKASKEMFAKGDVNGGVSSLARAERYLEDAVSSEREASAEGYNTRGLLMKLAERSIVHRETIEQLMGSAPTTAHPFIVSHLECPKRMISILTPRILAGGDNPPQNQ